MLVAFLSSHEAKRFKIESRISTLRAGSFGANSLGIGHDDKGIESMMRPSLPDTHRACAGNLISDARFPAAEHDETVYKLLDY
jgi:hypothetical protein